MVKLTITLEAAVVDVDVEDSVVDILGGALTTKCLHHLSWMRVSSLLWVHRVLVVARFFILSFSIPFCLLLLFIGKV